MRKASRQTSRKSSRKSSRQASTRKAFSRSHALEGLVSLESCFAYFEDYQQ